MKRKVVSLAVVLLFATTISSYAQSLKDFLNSSNVKDAVSNIVSGISGVKQSDLEGTWKYASPACSFTTEDLLKKAGGAIVANEVSEKLAGIYSKIGISSEKFGYTFADSTFVNKFMGRNPKGTYTFDAENQELNLQYQIAGLINIGKSEAKIEKSGNNIKLLFNADKLLQILTKLSSASKSSTIKTIGSVAEGYDGMLIGFELSK